MTWLNQIDAEPCNLNIKGDEVRGELDGDIISVFPATGSEKIGDVDVLYLDDPVFSDGGIVYGTVNKTGQDAQMQWNLIARLFGNDMCNVEPNGDAGFEVTEVVRMEQHSIEVGDPITDALYAYVCGDGAGIMLPDKE